MSFTAAAIILGVSAGLGVAGGATTAILAGGQAKKAKEQAKKYEAELKALESGMSPLSVQALGITDLSSQITNPYANLQVATSAAEMQATQTDISLANTLDLLRSTGAGAGGATALAREAALSKQGIAASIEAQEAENIRLRAQGEQQRQQLAMQEAARLQSAGLQVAQLQENRYTRQANRLAGLQDAYLGVQATSRQQMIGAISGTTGELASLGGTVASTMLG